MDTKVWTFLYNAYDSLLVFIGFYQFIFSAGSMMWVGNFQDICNLVAIAVTLLTGVLISLYYLIYQKRLKDFIEHWNQLNLEILRCPLGTAGSFRTMYFKIARSNVSFSKKILFLVFWTPFIYCSPVPIIDVIRGSYRANLPLPILYPYNDHLPGIYEVTFCLHVSGLVISVMKKIGNDCFFLSLFKIHTVYLRCLSDSINVHKDKFNQKSDAFIKKKQILWIKFHSEIIRGRYCNGVDFEKPEFWHFFTGLITMVFERISVCAMFVFTYNISGKTNHNALFWIVTHFAMNANELVSIYTPIIVIYYFNLIMIVVFGLFTQIKNDRDSFIQGFGVGGFGIINIFQLYMMCSSAEVLATEAERVALAIYDIRWYQMNNPNAKMLRLMLLVAKSPVQVTAFRARTFLLNKETFIGFITSSVTALMTFAKINDIRQSQSS